MSLHHGRIRTLTGLSHRHMRRRPPTQAFITRQPQTLSRHSLQRCFQECGTQGLHTWGICSCTATTTARASRFFLPRLHSGVIHTQRRPQSIAACHSKAPGRPPPPKRLTMLSACLFSHKWKFHKRKNYFGGKPRNRCVDKTPAQACLLARTPAHKERSENEF